MGCKHRFLWLGSYQSDEQFEKMLARNIGQASCFASQKGLVKGLDKVLDPDSRLDTISVISYPPYPKYPKIYVDEIKWSRTGKTIDRIIGYPDIKYISYLFRSKNLQKAVREWRTTCEESEKITVIIYEPSVSKLKAALYLKKQLEADIFVIIPDIPELVNLSANKLIKAGKKTAAKKMKKQFRSVDGFILYSACMADYYGFENNKWILMEGVFDPDEAVEPVDQQSEEHPVRLMYCGALDKFRGIPELLEAFDRMRERDYELWLCGAGSSDELIHEKEKEDKRIHHFGYLDSREEVLNLQRQADVLIHTRDITSPAAPYCFPSKLFEYFVTAKPVISVKIPGIPEEYFEHMIPIEPFTADGIVQAIRKVGAMSQSERKDMGLKARDFILKEKNSSVQAEKILNFIFTKESHNENIYE